MKSVYIRTFGCQMNVHDSEKILGILEKEGYSETASPEEANLIVLNTCTIREKAEQKFFSELGRLKISKKEGAKIAVAGCIAQQEGHNLYKKVPYIDLVIGPQNLEQIISVEFRPEMNTAISENPDIPYKDLPVKRHDRIKAWVAIMYGCNNFCSYCVVPYTRGRERSRPTGSILKEINWLAAQGYKEITLLGQNVNSYRNDTDFTGLLHCVNDIQGLERIRFVTSHPRDLSDGLISAMESLPKVCEHIHLPLQSGSNNILRLMNRGYTYEEYMKKIVHLKKKIPSIAITSDIIAGFPGETQDDHQRTLDALEDISFDGIFSFQFSRRPGTSAESLPDQIPDPVKSERLKEIIAIQDKISSCKNKSLEGTIQQLLIDNDCNARTVGSSGRTRTNKIVTVSNTYFQKGTMTEVRIIKGRRHSLEGIAPEK